MDGVLRRALDGKKGGITWRLQESLEDMEYAYDICLVSHKYELMQRKLADLWKESKKAGLEINSSKTEEIQIRKMYQLDANNFTMIFSHKWPLHVSDIYMSIFRISYI